MEYKRFRSIVSLTVWDVGGRSKIRPLLRHYYEGKTALVFVVDSNDRDRIQDAKIQLDELLAEEQLKGIPVLVFANKQDLRGALAPAELADELGLPLVRDNQWHVQGSCATTGDGILEGLDWLSAAMEAKRSGKKCVAEDVLRSKQVASMETSKDR